MDRIGPESYSWGSYVSAARWASYRHQIAGALRHAPATCLVIGKGDGLVPLVLAHQGVEVTVLDVRLSLSPDVLGDVRSLPFPDGAFDTVVCCQVLEHLPFQDFAPSVAELARVTSRAAVVSLPDNRTRAAVTLRVGRAGAPPVVVPMPWRARRLRTQNHRWELGVRGFDDREVTVQLGEAFTIDRTFTVPQNPYHRFFLLTRHSERVADVATVPASRASTAP